MSNRTISQVLNEYDGFDKAFWVSYSVDFNTLDFLIKKDFRNVMDPYYFHFICDARKLDESLSSLINTKNDLSILSSLQQYCTISPQFTEGAFHPKMLMLASETAILILVTSANATASGLLSNQDLIGEFYFDRNDEGDKDEIIALFQCMSSFSGWCIEAKEDLRILVERFPFLEMKVKSERVFVVPHEKSLLDQILNSDFKIKEVEEINIFVPFFDDSLQAVCKLAEIFKIAINIYSPNKNLKTTRKASLPENISFFYSGKLEKTIFHAKFYEFRLKKSSIVFWGSANCSFSALLSTHRNYEMLIKCQMSKEAISNLWGDLKNMDPTKVELGVVLKDDKQGDCILFYIQSVANNSGGMEITLDKEAINLDSDIFLKGINANNEVIELNIIKKNGKVLTFTPCDGLVICYLTKKMKTVSNLFYINNTFALTNRIMGQAGRYDGGREHIDLSKNINHVFGYFDLVKAGKQSKDHSPAETKRGFWRMPQFSSREVSLGLLALDGFINTRLLKFKNLKDEDEFPDADVTQKIKLPHEKATKDVEAKIDKELSKLSANILILKKQNRLNEILSDRWIEGLDIINCFVLDYLSDIEEIKDSDHIDRLSNMLYEVTKIGVWIKNNLFKKNKDNTHRLELIHTIQNIYFIFSLYQYRWYEKFYMSGCDREEDAYYKDLVKGAVFLKFLSSNKQAVSEHELLSIENFLMKLPQKKISIILLTKISNGTLRSPVSTVIFENSIESMLHIQDIGSQKMKLGTLLGEEKEFSQKAPLVKKDITCGV